MISFLTGSAGKYLIAGLAGAVALGSVWVHGYSSGKGACQSKHLRAQIAALHRQIEVRDKVIASHNERAEKDAAALAKLDERIKDAERYVDKIADDGCLTGDDTRKLQDIFRPGND